MSLLKANGLVIKEQKVSESDRLITILTAENGLVKAFAPNSLKLKSKNLSATQLLAYSRLSLYKSRDTYKVNDAQTIELFYKLRSDIEGLSLVGYFCELLYTLCPMEDNAEEYLKMMLNCSYLICEKKFDFQIIKAVFDLKICQYSGYMPDLTVCCNCEKESFDFVFFDVASGTLICDKCLIDNKNAFALSPSVLAAMRHIIYNDDKRIFAFNLSEKSLNELNCITESFVSYQTDKKYKTLDFYKTMR